MEQCIMQLKRKKKMMMRMTWIKTFNHLKFT
jgi:hypothetical protein